jgi:hypothetical protein
MDLLLLLLIAIAQDCLRKRLFHVNEAQHRWGGVLVPILLIWGISLTFVSRAIDKAYFNSPLPVGIGIGVAAASGVAGVWAMYRFVLKADEMIRRIETEALALGLGLGIVAFLVLNQLVHAGYEIFGILEPASAPIKPFLFSFVLGRFIVYLKYR